MGRERKKLNLIKKTYKKGRNGKILNKMEQKILNKKRKERIGKEHKRNKFSTED